MARILIVGCGGRGQALAHALVEQGHAVRGTTRDPTRMHAIAATGAEPYLGDPDRIATLMDALAQTTVVAWLMGTADAEDLHVGRLRMLTEKVVDTGVRGLLYEAAGTADPAWLEKGEMTVRAARATWNIPLQVLHTDPGDHEAWTRDAVECVRLLLEGE